MKTIKYLAAIALLIAVGMVSYECGRNSTIDKASKDYQAACMLSDICHFALDNDESGEFEELYYDYIDNIDCDPNAVITREEIQNYCWCY